MKGQINYHEKIGIIIIKRLIGCRRKDNEKAMIQLVDKRVGTFIACDIIFIVTNIYYKQLVEEQLLNILKENIICELMEKIQFFVCDLQQLLLEGNTNIP